MGKNKKGQNGRSQSNHGRGRKPTPAELEHHAKIHTAEQTTKRLVACTKTLSTLGVAGAGAWSASHVETSAPGGAPWWTWALMGIGWTLAITGFVLYLTELRRSQKLIERLAPQVKAAEKQEDPNRSSSQLDRRGETKGKE